MDALFWDHECGGYFTSPCGDDSIILRLKEDQVRKKNIFSLNLLLFVQ